MMIRVIYNGGGYDLVKDTMLDYYLERGIIAGFQRYHGWAVVGRDNIRQHARRVTSEQYIGFERRGKRDENLYVRWE